MDSTSILLEPSELDAVMARGGILIDARKAGDFKNGHIPGAVPLSTYDDIVSDTSLEGLKALTQALAYRYSTAGVTGERPVIIYEDETGPRAARELWMLELMGHKKARMLHGGLKQWVAEGGRIIEDTEIPTVRPKKIAVALVSGCLATADEVLRRAGNWDIGILDVRSELEWSGTDNTPCCRRRGHLPHAVHIEWTQFLENGRFKSADAIEALLDSHKINPRHDIVAYSHHGARSALAYFTMRHAGCAAARNLIGSWHEWSARDELPVEI